MSPEKYLSIKLMNTQAIFVFTVLLGGVLNKVIFLPQLHYYYSYHHHYYLACIISLCRVLASSKIISLAKFLNRQFYTDVLIGWFEILLIYAILYPRCFCRVNTLICLYRRTHRAIIPIISFIHMKNTGAVLRTAIT